MSSGSIRSFMHPLTPPHSSKARSNLLVLNFHSCSLAEDGVDEQTNPNPLAECSPQQDYEDASIGDLVPGPRRVSFTARIVNMYEQTVESKMPQAAKGCFRLLMKDDSALLLVASP